MHPSQHPDGCIVSQIGDADKGESPQLWNNIIIQGRVVKQESIMKFICIGKNYLAHAREMGSEAPKEPMFFFKSENAVPKQEGVFPYPSFSSDVHFETEVSLLIDTPVRNATEQEAASCFSQVTLGIDFTARDLQRKQKQLGFPWEIAKAFEESAPIGRWIPLTKDVQDLNFELKVNGETRQTGSTSRMIFPVVRLITYISRFVTLDPGDILMTGTPEGVGPVTPGDHLEGFLEGEKLLDLRVASQ